MHRNSICYVTEIDLDRKLGGAIMNDLRTISCLQNLVTVDTIYLKRQKYRSLWLAFLVFVWRILQSSFTHYQAYFSRGFFSSFTLILLKPIHQKKIIHNALSVPFPSSEAKYSNRNKLSGFIWFSVMRFLEKTVTSNVDAIVVAADSYATQLLRNGVQKNRIQTVTLYVEDEFFQLPVNPSVKGIFTFCYVGGFHPYHLLSPVIEAFEYLSKRNSNVELCLIGDGPLRHHIENEVSRRKLDQKVRFLGRLPHSAIPKIISCADSLIVPTAYGISTNLLEAAAAAKAIITLKRRGDITLEHYFRHGKEILYVDDTSPHEIAEAMMLVSENPKVRIALSLGSRKTAKRYFSKEVCLSHLQELVQKIGHNHQSESFSNQLNRK
jgi:glycosyltransferase involved in cell wall biosynthesis